jgi:CubicO group peptidase (beta-lactamase class C family)
MNFRRFHLSVFLQFVLALLLLCVCAARSANAQTQAGVVIPDTPAGKQFAAFLAALNTGKRETIQQFVSEHVERPPNGPLPVAEITERYLSLYNATRGFVVRKITASSSATITALVQTKLIEDWMEMRIFVTAEPPSYITAKAPYKMIGMGLSNIEMPAELLPDKRLTEREIRGKVDALLAKLAAADIFSGTVTLAKNGKPIYAKAFGLASKIWNIPNRVDTRFNLASITKMFTAVAVAQLVEQGKLAYTDTVGKVLPDYPNQDVAQKVTVHHLLSHTSGLIGARTLIEKSPQFSPARTIAEMVKPFVNEPLSFPPGQQFDYSNAGFILLGAIIEKASGQSYYDYVRDHIFKPAGMTNTDFYELDTNPPNLATGFKDGPHGTRLDNIFDLGIKGSPAGGAYSTGEDMTRFHTALMQVKLLSRPALETLWRGVTEEPDRHTEYGYGAQLARYNGARTVGHGGGWKGITNRFEMYPELGYTVVILSNYDNDPNAIAHKLGEWLTQGTFREKPDAPTPPALTLTAEVSSTTVTPGNPITIKVMVKNSGGIAHASVIDMEIKDASGAKANQQYTMGQKIEAGQTRTYSYVWTPTAAGKYIVDIGAFGPGWRPKYLFESGVATITVK